MTMIFDTNVTYVTSVTPMTIAYASRPLKKHEKNYSAYLVEMAAAVWGH
jgi:hypothetical protein